MESKEKEHLMELKSLLNEADGTNNHPGFSYWDTTKGIIAGFLTVFFITLSAVSVQLLERAVPDFELNAIRYIFPIPFIASWMTWKKQFPGIPKSELIGLAMYCFTGFLLTVGTYVSVTFLPAATVQCIIVTSCMVAGVLLFAIFLKDKPTLLTMFLIAICIVGVILVIQPDFIFSDNTEVMTLNHVALNISNNNLTFETEAIRTLNNMTGEPNSYNPDGRDGPDGSDGSVLEVLKLALPVVGGTAISADVLVIKKRPYLAEHIADVLFWTFLANVVLSIIIMVTLETPVLPSNWKDIFYIFLHSISNTFVWPLYIYSVSYITGNTYSMIYSTTTVFMLIAQYTVLSSILPGHRNWIEVVGVALVTLGSILGSVLEFWRTQSS